MSKLATTLGRHTIRFGTEVIPFDLEYRERRRLSISVHPDRRVSVVAPFGRSEDEIVPRVQKKAAWIAKQRAYFEQFHPLPTSRKYVGGETHLYLGRQYRLKLHECSTRSVKLLGRYLHVFASGAASRDAVRGLLDEWYDAHARSIFDARLRQCVDNAPSLRLLRPDVLIRRMHKRWGSCSSAGRIVLNLDLIKAPVSCIDYVITHELCHLKVHHHGPAFYRLLARCMPDWEERKARMDSLVI